jgi:hypothetical protein
VDRPTGDHGWVTRRSAISWGRGRERVAIKYDEVTGHARLKRTGSVGGVVPCARRVSRKGARPCDRDSLVGQQRHGLGMNIRGRAGRGAVRLGRHRRECPKTGSVVETDQLRRLPAVPVMPQLVIRPSSFVGVRIG